MRDELNEAFLKALGLEGQRIVRLELTLTVNGPALLKIWRYAEPDEEGVDALRTEMRRYVLLDATVEEGALP